MTKAHLFSDDVSYLVQTKHVNACAAAFKARSNLSRIYEFIIWLNFE